MKIQYVLGDLLASDLFYIAHGCNAQGVMRSGIAKSIREQYPQVYKDYRSAYLTRGLEVGDVIRSKMEDRCVFNIISQEFYGRDPNIVYVSYDAIEYAIKSLNLYYYTCRGLTTIGFPMIGAGLANGDWNIISNIIEKYSEFQPVVYVLDSEIYSKLVV